MLKNEILKNLQTEKMNAIKLNSTNSNKIIKACDFAIKLVNECFSSKADYNLLVSAKGNINKGCITEIAYNNAKGNELKAMHSKGLKDCNNRKYYEIKAYTNPSNLPNMSCINTMDNESGFTFITYQGVYNASVNDLKPYITSHFTTRQGKLRLNQPQFNDLIKLGIIKKNYKDTELLGLK